MTDSKMRDSIEEKLPEKMNIADNASLTFFTNPVYLNILQRKKLCDVKDNTEEVKFYQTQIDKLKIELIHKELVELEKLHYQIWALEDDFKKCRLDGIDLAEIGRRALAIRDLNNSRIALKNKMAELLQDPVREIKTTL
jgi:hypothetical protein